MGVGIAQCEVYNAAWEGNPPASRQEFHGTLPRVQSGLTKPVICLVQRLPRLSRRRRLSERKD